MTMHQWSFPRHAAFVVGTRPDVPACPARQRHGRISRNFFGWLAVAAGAVGTLLAPQTARAAEQRILRGHLPMDMTKLQAAGRLEGAKRLQLAIALPWRNPGALSNLLAQLYDPASPKFHQWLAPEQFAAAFAPTEADYQRVIAFAQAQGLTVTGTYGNRMLVDAQARWRILSGRFTSGWRFISIRPRRAPSIRPRPNRRWMPICRSWG